MERGKRAWIYARVEPTASGGLLSIRKDALCRDAQRQDLEIVGITAEMVHAECFARYGLIEICAAAEKRMFDALFIASYSALGSDPQKTRVVLDSLTKLGVQVYIADLGDYYQPLPPDVRSKITRPKQ